MDFAFSLFFSLLAVTGLCAIAVALFHPHPSQTLFIRALCWPGIKPTDRIALPLGAVHACAGTLLATYKWHWVPMSVSVALLLLGFVSAVFLGLRRSEA